MRRSWLWIGLAAVMTAAAPARAQRLSAVCPGDCSQTCSVGSSDLVIAVEAALEQRSSETCDSADISGDGATTIDELVASVNSGVGGCSGPPCQTRIVEIEPGENDQETILGALIDAEPGDVIHLKAGTYRLTGQLSLDVDDVTIRGDGMDETILSFDQQTTGAEGLLVTANRFVIEDIALINSPGDLMKIIGANGLTIRRVRTEWTNGPSTQNGSYGLYPVDCRNILIEDSIVRGASDAGFYVGQSHGIILRRSLAEYNVAGVEIENCTDADVYDNIATNNTGGILVFNLPGLAFLDGRRTRVFNNHIFENNTPNFAPRGTTVAAVPKGTGLMILANDEVEVFDNTFRDNGTTNALLIGYSTAQVIGNLGNPGAGYDRYSEGIYIHDNVYIGGGADPESEVANLLSGTVGPPPLPQILFDGQEDARKRVNGQLPDHLRLCIRENEVTFYKFSLTGVGASPDLEPYDCSHPSLPAVRIPGVELPPSPTPSPTPTEEEPTPTPTPTTTESQEARCRVPPGSGVNVDPTDRSCELLSSYRLFRGNPADHQPNDGVVPYDLNTQLFSDYTHKQRFAWLPPGKKATYSDRDSFEFPVGSVLVKTFSYPADLRDPEGPSELLETRLLVHTPTGWVGLPYVWNAAKTDAVLKTVGAALPVSGIQQNGEIASFTHNVPNSNQCKGCHREHAEKMGPIGPKARHMNKPYAYTSGTMNQLTRWTQLGILEGAPADPATVERVAVFDDPSTGSTEQRARAYLDINCAHCHNPTGPARTTGLYLDFHETTREHLGQCKSPTAAGRGTGNLPYVVTPGNAANSILSFRMKSIEPEIAMPELGRTRIHAEAVAVIESWINSMPAGCNFE